MRRFRQLEQRGIALFTSLIFLLVITIVGITALSNSTTEYKLAANTVNYEIAFNNSESARKLVSNAGFVENQIYERGIEGGWDKTDFPSNLTVNSSFPDLGLLHNNQAGEDPTDNSTLLWDLNYSTSNIEASIYVIDGRATQNKGGGMEAHAGYLGAGKSLAKGGFLKFLEIRSRGKAGDNFKVLTGNDFKIVPKN